MSDTTQTAATTYARGDVVRLVRAIRYGRSATLPAGWHLRVLAPADGGRWHCHPAGTGDTVIVAADAIELVRAAPVPEADRPRRKGTLKQAVRDRRVVSGSDVAKG